MIELDRYRRMSEIIQVAAEKELQVRKKLEPLFGILNIYTDPSGIKVIIDRNLVKRSPVQGLELAQGTHSIMAQSPCHAPTVQEAPVLQGRTNKIVVKLEPLWSAIVVSAKDDNGRPVRGATVYVDNKEVGKANTTIKVPKCSSELKVSARGFGDYTQALSLKHKQKKQINEVEQDWASH